MKGSEGRRVSLGTIAEVREGHRSESAVLRMNLRPAVVVTADVPPVEVTAACVHAAKAVVPQEFEVFDPPRG